MSEDYRQGYKDGFEAGFEAGGKLNKPLYQITPNLYQTVPPWHNTAVSACLVCGRLFDGNPMGFVCSYNNCPSKITCKTSTTMASTTNE